MEKLVELSDQEALIDFQLNCKCRATMRLTSLCASAPIAFKVQTSSPQKFLVNPPNGLIPPLSYATFQIVLKPQTQLPPSFPRSPSDRFLIKTAKFQRPSDSTQVIQPESIQSWFNSETKLVTYDLKLKVAYVGVFLLRHAMSTSDLEAVKSLVKRQKSAVTDLSPSELESLTTLITNSNNSEKVVHLLSEAGLKLDERAKVDNGEVVEESKWVTKGWTELHVAAANNRADDVARYIREACDNSASLDCTDNDGYTALHVAADKGNAKCVKMLAGGGANVNFTSKGGQTAMYTAASKGDLQMVSLLMELGADPTISIGSNGWTAVDVARDKGHEEVVMRLEQGDLVLAAARRGEAHKLKQLLKKGAKANYRDQYGLTGLHAAAIKGHTDCVKLLTESGMDLEWQDMEGHTPLHLAVVGGNIQTVELLVRKGANMNAVSAKGATPSYMAKAMGHEDISELLLSITPLHQPWKNINM